MLTSPWAPWVYHYLIGGLIFALSLLVVLKQGAIDLKHPKDKWLVCMIAAGLLGYGLIHLIWISKVIS